MARYSLKASTVLSAAFLPFVGVLVQMVEPFPSKYWGTLPLFILAFIAMLLLIVLSVEKLYRLRGKDFILNVFLTVLDYVWMAFAFSLGGLTMGLSWWLAVSLTLFWMGAVLYANRMHTSHHPMTWVVATALLLVLSVGLTVRITANLIYWRLAVDSLVDARNALEDNVALLEAGLEWERTKQFGEEWITTRAARIEKLKQEIVDMSSSLKTLEESQFYDKVIFGQGKYYLYVPFKHYWNSRRSESIAGIIGELDHELQSSHVRYLPPPLEDDAYIWEGDTGEVATEGK